MSRKENLGDPSGSEPKRNPDKNSPSESVATNADDLKSMIQWLLPTDAIFNDIKLHGNSSWVPRTLVTLVLCWTWAENRYLTDAFTSAFEWCRCIVDGKVLTTYQGMMNALMRWTSSFIPLLCKVMHQKMEQIGGEFWEVAGWVPIAFDGSRDTAPRTKSNEDGFCAKNYGKGKTAKHRKKKTKGMRRTKNKKNPPSPPAPQVWITLMWHIGLRLPWTWRLGASNSSERDHVMKMVEGENFPKNTLFCGDAGFVGYRLWAQMINSGYHFLVRVGGNVNLLTEECNCTLESNMTVLSWPQDAMNSNLPPLRLRLIKVQIGRTWMWLLTSVLDRSKLTVEQTKELYKKRWGIEVEFRGLKQTLDKAKLRCHNQKRVLVELNWSLMGMAIAELFALKEQLSASPSESQECAARPCPSKRSLAMTMRALRYCLTHLREQPAATDSLREKLQKSVTDDYNRTAPKKSRYRPPNPDKQPLGQPKLRQMTTEESNKLKSFPIKKLVP